MPIVNFAAAGYIDQARECFCLLLDKDHSIWKSRIAKCPPEFSPQLRLRDEEPVSRTSGSGGGGGQPGEKFSIESILGKVCTSLYS